MFSDLTHEKRESRENIKNRGKCMKRHVVVSKKENNNNSHGTCMTSWKEKGKKKKKPHILV